MVGSQIVKMWSGMRWHCTDVQSLHRTKCSKFKESYLVSVLLNKSATESFEFLTQFPSSRYSCALELPIRDNFKATRFVAEFFTICCQIFLQIFHNLPPDFSPNMPKDFLLKGQLFSSESSDDCIPNQECNIYYHYVSLFPSLFNNIIIVIVKVIIIVIIIVRETSPPKKMFFWEIFLKYGCFFGGGTSLIIIFRWRQSTFK